VDQAINAGLALTCYARLALHGMADEGVAQGTILQVHRLLEETVLDLCRGQHLDLHYRTERPSLEQYLEMVRLKTGVLVGAACEIGALVAGAPEKRAAARQFGEALGVGFQLRDDYLGAWGNPQEMGKGADDLKDGKWSLPLLVAARQDGPNSSVPTAIDWMVEEWTRRADGHLSEIGLPSSWGEMFVELTQALASRPA
jgi:geranylgeranyl diphosphate synthase type I